MGIYYYSISFILLTCFCHLYKCNLHQHIDTVLNHQNSFKHNVNQCTTKTRPVVLLLNYIAKRYLKNNCYAVLLYDDYFYRSDKYNDIIEQLLLTFPTSLTHGRIVTVNTNHYMYGDTLKSQETNCKAYILLTKDVESALEIIGPQPDSKVIIVPQASQWQINSFLSGTMYHIINLLIIADPSLQFDQYSIKNKIVVDINMFTQNLYVDGIGGSTSQLVTAWRCDHVTRPNVDLFPKKLKNGFNGFMFRVSGAQQPPFVYRLRNQIVSRSFEDRVTVWDGNEIRLIRLVAEMLNFTLRIQESSDSGEDSAKRVLKDIQTNKADIALAGIPLIDSRLNNFTFSVVHSQDCANFVSLTSTALPKYRAIMGPFKLSVWISIIIIYLFAIIPITYSAKKSLSFLLHKPSEIENMFWYVFGTFTNCFTFSGKGSWTGSNHSSTRIFIGIYWVFTIIITAAYTGCIIAFIMLPAYPSVVDTARDLIRRNYKIGILNGSGWESTFQNADDPVTTYLLKQADFVPSMAIGLRNVSRSMYRRPYAFLGSKEEMKYLIKTNFTPSSRHKKSLFHLSKECFVPMMLSAAFPKNAIYAAEISSMMTRAIEHGFYVKLSKDVEWDQYRSSTGKLLQVSSTNLKLGTPEDRQLTLDDTQGMFLLYGVGVGSALLALIVECYLSIHKKLQKCINDRYCVDDSSAYSKNPSILITSHNELTSYFGSKISYTESVKLTRYLSNQLTTMSVLELPKNECIIIRRNSY